MKLHELRPAAGSRSTPKKVGRGTGSSPGRNTGKGEKGQNARSGGGVGPGLEGDRMLLYRRLSKRGFTNPFTKYFVTINADRLNILDSGTEVALELLLERRIVSKLMDGVKILGSGNIEKSLAIAGCKLLRQTAEKIVVARGKVEVK